MERDRLGKKVICSICGEEKAIGRLFNDEFTCNDCIKESEIYVCPICPNELKFTYYKSHLLKHSHEELAEYISNKAKEAKESRHE